jgi:hypothetical protein
MAYHSVNYFDVRKCNTASCKAAGGVRTYEEVAMIKLGVKRIGTSGAKAIANGENTTLDTNYTIKIMGFVTFILSFSFLPFARPRFIRVKYFS